MPLRRFREGKFTATAPGASAAIDLIYSSGETRGRNVHISEVAPQISVGCNATGVDAATVVIGAASCLFNIVLGGVGAQWGGRNDRTLARYKRDEAETREWLKDMGSAARRIYQRFRLTREIVRESSSTWRRGRAGQASLCSTIRATRFKSFAKEVPRSHQPTKRPTPGCGKEDILEHMLECPKMRERPRCPAFLADYLVGLDRRTNQANPGIPPD